MASTATLSRQDIIEMGELPDEYWKKVFDKLDRNGDGTLRMSEFQKKDRDRKCPRGLPEDARRKLFRKADVDRNGLIDFEEFLKLMRSPDLKKRFDQLMLDRCRDYAQFIVPPLKSGGDVADGTEYLALYKCCPPPILIIMFSLVEIAVYIYYCVTLNSFSAYGPVPSESPLIYNPFLRYQVWRYITYMFIHVGFLHIFNNVLIQVLLGIPLEMANGPWRVAIVYMSGVIAGSLGTSITDPTTYLAGASGGVYSILTAHFAVIILNWKDMKWPWLQLGVFSLIMGVDVGSAVYNRYAGGNEDVVVAYAAHVCGALAGLLVGIGVLRNVSVSAWEKRLWWASVILFGVLVFIAVIWNAAFPSYFLPSH